MRGITVAVGLTATWSVLLFAGFCRSESATARRIAVSHAANTQSGPGTLPSNGGSREGGEARAVVTAFIKALHQQDWSAASALFSSDFQSAHSRELASGRLLRWDPRREGKSAKSVLYYPRCRVGEPEIRGDYAWVSVQAGGDDRWAQMGLTTLELVREKGRWVLVRFPPSEAAFDAARAYWDGTGAGRWVRAMLQDRAFTPPERAQVRAILPAYYALMAQWQYRGVVSLPSSRGLSPATLEGLDEIARLLKSQPNLRLAAMTFWREPTPGVRAQADTLAAQALQAAFADIASAQGRFAELKQFDRAHVRIDHGTLWYAPLPPTPGKKLSAPTIGIQLQAPCLMATQWAYPRIILPSLKVEVARIVTVDDQPLKAFVKKVIDHRTSGLVQLEEQLGGTPIRQNW